MSIIRKIIRVSIFHNNFSMDGLNTFTSIIDREIFHNIISLETKDCYFYDTRGNTYRVQNITMEKCACMFYIMETPAAM